MNERGYVTNRKILYLILIHFTSSSYFGYCMAERGGEKIVIVIRASEFQPVFRGQYGFASGFIRWLY